MYQEPRPMGGTDGEPEPRIIRGSVTPKWYEDYEKEQADKLALLRLQIWRVRTDAFTESTLGSREHKLQMQAMTYAYDVCLNRIKGLIKEV